jgi:hypothetical protein
MVLINPNLFFLFLLLNRSSALVVAIRYNQVENLDSPLKELILSITLINTSWVRSSASVGFCTMPRTVLYTISCQSSTIVLNAASSRSFSLAIKTDSVKAK